MMINTVTNIEKGQWAFYRLGDVIFKGIAEDAGDGMYWFTTYERLRLGRMDLLASASDVEIIEDTPLHIDDLDELIEYALFLGDKEWFMELTEQMNLYVRRVIKSLG